MAHLTPKACFWKTYHKKEWNGSWQGLPVLVGLWGIQRTFQQYQKGTTIFCEISAERCYSSALVPFIDLAGQTQPPKPAILLPSCYTGNSCTARCWGETCSNRRKGGADASGSEQEQGRHRDEVCMKWPCWYGGVVGKTHRTRSAGLFIWTVRSRVPPRLLLGAVRGSWWSRGSSEEDVL